MVKLETGRDPYVESGDSWLERLGSGMWQADTSKVVARACVS
jgi:type IV secretory pathway TrbF-like protein